LLGEEKKKGIRDLFHLSGKESFPRSESITEFNRKEERGTTGVTGRSLGKKKEKRPISVTKIIEGVQQRGKFELVYFRKRTKRRGTLTEEGRGIAFRREGRRTTHI